MVRSRPRTQLRAGLCRRRGLRPYLLAGLLGAALVTYISVPAGGALPAVVVDPPTPYTPPPGTPPVAAQAAVPAANPMDEPLRLVTEAARTYQQVRDYTCVLIKQERVKGRMQEENVIQLSFRQQPFSVYMRWLAPKGFAGQEVCYVQGRNNNMMRVHATGVIAHSLGFISISPDDPRALEHSRHKITETGFGNLLNTLYQEWTRVRQTARAQVRLGEYRYDNRLCSRVEIIYLDRGPQSYCWRSVTYFDKQTHMPIRMECYDWPRQGGPPEGELLESFSYAGLQLNVNVPDATFNH